MRLPADPARRALHFALAMIGAALWLVIAALSAALVWLSVFGAWVWPGAERGNCWTYALPRWIREGGGLLITLDRLRLGRVPVPHAAWVRGAVEDVLETEPVRRRNTLRGSLYGLRTLYFRFAVRHTERRPVTRR